MAERPVAIVGAGLAGLVAARELRRRGREAVVLEAQDRVGGRTLNHTFDDGTVVEVGGQWVGPTQDRLIALAADLGIDTYPSWDEGEHLLHRDGELTAEQAGAKKDSSSPQVRVPRCAVTESTELAAS